MEGLVPELREGLRAEDPLARARDGRRDHQPGHALRMVGRDPLGDAAADVIAADQHAVEPQLVEQRDDARRLPRSGVGRVRRLRRSLRLPEAAQVGDDHVGVGERGGDRIVVVPPRPGHPCSSTIASAPVPPVAVVREPEGLELRAQRHGGPSNTAGAPRSNGSSAEEYHRPMAGASRELFPTDRGLVARMAVATVATPLVVIAALAAVVAVAPTRLVIGVGIAIAIGLYLVLQERAATVRAREVSPESAPELHAVGRAPVRDRRPAQAEDRARAGERQPTVGSSPPGRDRARLHLTQGLVDRLEPRELEAVIAHELAHLAHRDAIVMTVVGGPGAVLLGGGSMLAGRWIWPLQLGGLTRRRSAGSRASAPARCRATASSPPMPARSR